MTFFRFLTVLVFLFVSRTLSAQSEADARMALTVGPNISFLANFHGRGLNHQVPRFGLRVRFDYEQSFGSSRWSCRLGLGYTRLNYRTAIDLSTLQWPSLDTSGIIKPNPVLQDKYLEFRDRFVTLPVAVRYAFTRWFYAELEANGNLLINGSGNASVFMPGFGFDLGLQVPVGARMQIFAQPAARFILNTGLKDQLRILRLHPYDFALELGVRRGL